MNASDSQFLPILQAPDNLADRVTREIREAIATGRLAPQMKLRQEDLAAQLRVSRQPVREALKRLEAEGLVVALAAGGVAVCEVTEEDVREIYDLRLLLEPRAAALAAERATPSERDRVGALSARMVAAEGRSLDTLTRLNTEFHWAVYRAAHASRLLSMIDQLWHGWMSYGDILQARRAATSASQHEPIAAAIAAGDAAAAYAGMKTHLQDGAEDYLTNYLAPRQQGSPEAHEGRERS